MLTMLFGAIVATLTLGTYSMEDCRELEHKPKACIVSEKLDKVK